MVDEGFPSRADLVLGLHLHTVLLVAVPDSVAVKEHSLKTKGGVNTALINVKTLTHDHMGQPESGNMTSTGGQNKDQVMDPGRVETSELSGKEFKTAVRGGSAYFKKMQTNNSHV